MKKIRALIRKYPILAFLALFLFVDVLITGMIVIHAYHNRLADAICAGVALLITIVCEGIMLYALLNLKKPWE